MLPRAVISEYHKGHLAIPLSYPLFVHLKSYLPDC
ncbi:hypothetical protein [Shigella phage ESh3]|nr:hypothetical protein [Shigella phage ESh3]